MKNNLILEYNNSFGLKMNNIFFNCLSHLTTCVPSHSFGCALYFAKNAVRGKLVQWTESIQGIVKIPSSTRVGSFE